MTLLTGRFTSADTIIPGGVQGYDRYAYVNNSPVNYTDPSGHKCTDGEEECAGVNGAGGNNTTTTTTTSIGNSCNIFISSCGGSSNGNNNGTTITEKAMNGDLLSMVDLIIPTNLGWNLQGSGSLGLPIGFSVGVEVNAGLTWNLVSDQLIFNLDFGGSTGGGVIFTPPVPIYEVAVTTGPSVGWFSSEPNSGDFNGSLSGTLAAEGAVSASISVPMNVDMDDPFYVDPHYGQVPVTLYGGGGVGCCTAGGSGSASVTAVSVDLSFLLPWHWFGGK